MLNEAQAKKLAAELGQRGVASLGVAVARFAETGEVSQEAVDLLEVAWRDAMAAERFNEALGLGDLAYYIKGALELRERVAGEGSDPGIAVGGGVGPVPPVLVSKPVVELLDGLERVRKGRGRG